MPVNTLHQNSSLLPTVKLRASTAHADFHPQNIMVDGPDGIVELSGISVRMVQAHPNFKPTNSARDSLLEIT
jgi:hypothetical protein